jgi:hypothetical protein
MSKMNFKFFVRKDTNQAINNWANHEHKTKIDY